jgi:hypothetical protein
VLEDFLPMLTITQFETLEWSLETPDGQKVSLLDSQGLDPFQDSAINKGAP